MDRYRPLDGYINQVPEEIQRLVQKAWENTGLNNLGSIGTEILVNQGDPALAERVRTRLYAMQVYIESETDFDVAINLIRQTIVDTVNSFYSHSEETISS